MAHTCTTLVLSLLVLLAACADDDPVPIEEIPEDLKLVDLSSAEYTGVCEWVTEVSKQEVPAGTNCNGVPLRFSGCMRVPDDCPGTVGQWKECMSTFLARIGDDPCSLFEAASSLDEFEQYIEETPGCETLSPCASVMM